MTEQEKRIQRRLLAMIAESIIEGFDYLEGLVLFRAGVFLMEEIHRDPQIDEGFLADKAAELVRTELARVR